MAETSTTLSEETNTVMTNGNIETINNDNQISNNVDDDRSCTNSPITENGDNELKPNDVEDNTTTNHPLLVKRNDNNSMDSQNNENDPCEQVNGNVVDLNKQENNNIAAAATAAGNNNRYLLLFFFFFLFIFYKNCFTKEYINKENQNQNILTCTQYFVVFFCAIQLICTRCKHNKWKI